MSTEKRCSKCGEVKPVSEFSKHAAHKDGLKSQCKACCSKYYQENKEERAKWDEQYYQENKAKILSRNKRYYQEHYGKHTSVEGVSVLKSYVYLIKSQYGSVKIGITKDVNRRLMTLGTASPTQLSVAGCKLARNARAIEKELHHKFKSKRIYGEWFNLSQEDINWIIDKHNFTSRWERAT